MFHVSTLLPPASVVDAMTKQLVAAARDTPSAAMVAAAAAAASSGLRFFLFLLHAHFLFLLPADFVNACLEPVRLELLLFFFNFENLW